MQKLKCMLGVGVSGTAICTRQPGWGLPCRVETGGEDHEAGYQAEQGVLCCSLRQWHYFKQGWDIYIFHLMVASMCGLHRVEGHTPYHIMFLRWQLVGCLVYAVQYTMKMNMNVYRFSLIFSISYITLCQHLGKWAILTPLDSRQFIKFIMFHSHFSESNAKIWLRFLYWCWNWSMHTVNICVIYMRWVCG